MDTEKIEPLPTSIEIERVIDGNVVKTFQCAGTVLVLDKTIPTENREGMVVNFTNPVPVKDDAGILIGFATLRLEGKRVEADFFLDYHTPTRLEIETKAKKLYPYALGVEAIALDVDENGSEKIESIEIDSIGLSGEEPLDPRIEPL